MCNEYSSKCVVGATKHVAKLGKPVQIMIRLANHGGSEGYGLGDGQMSGWLFMSGEEEE